MFKRNTTGFIKLQRDIQEWEWYGEPIMVALWVHLLINANWEDSEWRGEAVLRGQFITSISTLSTETGLSVKQVRTCLSRLEKGKQIVTKGASKWTKITICNYDSYYELSQAEGQTKGKQEGEQRATIKEDKEDNNKTPDFSPETEEIYAIYPSSCPYSKRRTGKGKENKKKIQAMLKSWTKEQLAYSITQYLADCEKTQTYIKDFGTLLNKLDRNGPDLYTQAPQEESAAPAPVSLEDYIAKRQSEIPLEYPQDRNETDEQYERRKSFIVVAHKPNWENEWRKKYAKGY